MIHSYNGSQEDALFLNFVLVKKSTCFGQTCSPASRVLILHLQQLVYVILVMLTEQTVYITSMTYTNCCKCSIKTSYAGE